MPDDGDDYDLAPEPERPKPKPRQPADGPVPQRPPQRTPQRPPPVRPRDATGGNGQTLHEQAARVSWLAPGVLALLTVLTASLRTDRTTAAVVLVVQSLIFLGGLIALVYAWVVYFKNRGDGLPRGAVAGLVLNALLIIGLIAAGVVVATGGLDQP